MQQYKISKKPKSRCSKFAQYMYESLKMFTKGILIFVGFQPSMVVTDTTFRFWS